jgi:hypothetical protein
MNVGPVELIVFLVGAVLLVVLIVYAVRTLRR